MTKLVKNLKPSFRKSMYQNLEKMGYASKVYVDECQAYLSTGVPDKFTVNLGGEDKPFIKLYEGFYNDT